MASAGEAERASCVSYFKPFRGLSLSYLLAKNSSSLIGGFATGSGFDLRRRATHSFWLTSAKSRPAQRMAGKRSSFQLKLRWLTTFITFVVVSERATSTIALATTSTGSHVGLSSSLGMAPMVIAACNMIGMASVSFQMPWRVSPMTCPTRRTRALIPVFSAASEQIFSVTSFDCA